MECIICFEEKSDQIFYQDNENSLWKLVPYCLNCINEMKEKQWNIYVNNIENEKCKKSLTRLLKLGPPTKIRDPSLPCNNPTEKVYQFKVNNELMNSFLKNYYTGEKMEKYKQFITNYLSEI